MEWFAHAPMALKAGVPADVIEDLRSGRKPAGAAEDQQAIYDFVHELYETRRVSDKTYKRLHAFLDDKAMVEFAGILGYYALISMTLNVFHMLPPRRKRSVSGKLKGLAYDRQFGRHVGDRRTRAADALARAVLKSGPAASAGRPARPGRIAAHDDQRLQVGHALDAFGDRDAAEAVCEIDRRLADRRVVRVGRTILHEGRSTLSSANWSARRLENEE